MTFSPVQKSVCRVFSRSIFSFQTVFHLWQFTFTVFFFFFVTQVSKRLWITGCEEGGRKNIRLAMVKIISHVDFILHCLRVPAAFPMVVTMLMIVVLHIIWMISMKLLRTVWMVVGMMIKMTTLTMMMILIMRDNHIATVSNIVHEKEGDNDTLDNDKVVLSRKLLYQ